MPGLQADLVRPAREPVREVVVGDDVARAGHRLVVLAAALAQHASRCRARGTSRRGRPTGARAARRGARAPRGSRAGCRSTGGRGSSCRRRRPQRLARGGRRRRSRAAGAGGTGPRSSSSRSRCTSERRRARPARRRSANGLWLDDRLRAAAAACSARASMSGTRSAPSPRAIQAATCPRRAAASPASERDARRGGACGEAARPAVRERERVALERCPARAGPARGRRAAGCRPPARARRPPSSAPRSPSPAASGYERCVALQVAHERDLLTASRPRRLGPSAASRHGRAAPSGERQLPREPSGAPSAAVTGRRVPSASSSSSGTSARNRRRRASSSATGSGARPVPSPRGARAGAPRRHGRAARRRARARPSASRWPVSVAQRVRTDTATSPVGAGAARTIASRATVSSTARSGRSAVDGKRTRRRRTPPDLHRDVELPVALAASRPSRCAARAGRASPRSPTSAGRVSAWRRGSPSRRAGATGAVCSRDAGRRAAARAAAGPGAGRSALTCCEPALGRADAADVRPALDARACSPSQRSAVELRERTRSSCVEPVDRRAGSSAARSVAERDSRRTTCPRTRTGGVSREVLALEPQDLEQLGHQAAADEVPLEPLDRRQRVGDARRSTPSRNALTRSRNSARYSSSALSSTLR